MRQRLNSAFASARSTKALHYLSALVLASSAYMVTTVSVNAATLTSASLSIEDPRPSQTGIDYDFQASGVTTSAIQCIKMVFATTATGTTVPTGMDTTGAALDATTDYVPTPASWSVDATTNGTVEITFGTGETPASAGGRNVVLTGIDNGSTAEAGYFLQVDTYNNTDCSTSPVDSVDVQFIFTNGQTVSLTVDPTLTFSVGTVAGSQTVNGATTTEASTTSTIPFGIVTTGSNEVVAQDLTVSTNSSNGYTVYLRYTGQLSNGADNITNHSGTNASPSSFSSAGTEAFGYTTDDSTLGTGTADRFDSNLWAAPTTTNTEVAYSSGAVSSETTRVGYQVGIDGNTPAGTYQSTVIYTATPVY